jgi:hypothetical protein
MNQAAVNDQVQVGHNYHIDYDYCFDTVRSDLVYYRKDYHDDPAKIREVHTPWDPGKSNLQYPLKISA